VSVTGSQGATAGLLWTPGGPVAGRRAGTLVIVQERRPDRFFDATQQQRLPSGGRWRTARVQADAADQEQAELDALVEPSERIGGEG